MNSFIFGMFFLAQSISLIFNIEKIISSKNLLSLFSNNLSIYHLDLIFIGILFTFSSIHFLGFNIMPRRIPDFPDSFYSWNLLSSVGSGVTLLSLVVFLLLLNYRSLLSSHSLSLCSYIIYYKNSIIVGNLSFWRNCEIIILRDLLFGKEFSF